MSWSSRKKKKGHFFVTFILSEGNFLQDLCFISTYSVLNKLPEYTYFHISKNITSYTFVAKIVESLQCILKAIANLFSYGKRGLILYENNYYNKPYKKVASFEIDIFLSTITFQFLFHFRGRGVFFFLMASYLHKKFQRN